MEKTVNRTEQGTINLLKLMGQLILLPYKVAQELINTAKKVTQEFVIATLKFVAVCIATFYTTRVYLNAIEFLLTGIVSSIKAGLQVGYHLSGNLFVAPLMAILDPLVHLFAGERQSQARKMIEVTFNLLTMLASTIGITVLTFRVSRELQKPSVETKPSLTQSCPPESINEVVSTDTLQIKANEKPTDDEVEKTLPRRSERLRSRRTL